jgi:hypothetical protein
LINNLIGEPLMPTQRETLAYQPPQSGFQGTVRGWYYLYYSAGALDGHWEAYYPTLSDALSGADEEKVRKFLERNDGCTLEEVRVLTSDNRKGWLLGKRKLNPPFDKDEHQSTEWSETVVKRVKIGTNSYQPWL